MKKIKLGHSGLEVSALCMGSDVLGSKHNRETSFAVLDAFRERGGSFLDTGNFYAAWLPGFKGGESESTIGEWLKARGCRNEMVVGTKLGFDYPGSSGGLSASEINSECDKSLRRLGTDRIDIYWSHRDDRDTPQAETMEAFDRLVEAGKIRAIGASNLRVWRIAQANEIARANGWVQYSAVEQRYTYARPHHAADFGPQLCIGDELREYAAVSGVALVAYSILLGGAYERVGATLPPQYAGTESDKRVAELKAVAAETGATTSQVIIAWIRQQSPAILPIIAASKPAQIAECVDALKLVLAASQMKRLNTAGDPSEAGGWIKPS
jgi:aryl-alcohol dehydrogenase-like predicted oxidoreductase